MQYRRLDVASDQAQQSWLWSFFFGQAFFCLVANAPVYCLAIDSEAIVGMVFMR